MARGRCSICAAPPAVHAAIDDQLEKRTPLRQIVIDSKGSVSRAALSRHRRHCLGKLALVEHGSMLSGLSSGKGRMMLVFGEDGSGGFYDHGAQRALTNDDQFDFDNDVFVMIEYEQPPKPKPAEAAEIPIESAPN